MASAGDERKLTKIKQIMEWKYDELRLGTRRHLLASFNDVI